MSHIGKAIPGTYTRRVTLEQAMAEMQFLREQTIQHYEEYLRTGDVAELEYHDSAAAETRFFLFDVNGESL